MTELSQTTDNRGVIVINNSDIPASACYGTNPKAFVVSERYRIRKPLRMTNCAAIEEQEYARLVTSDGAQVKAFIDHFPNSVHVVELRAFALEYAKQQEAERRAKEAAEAARAKREQAAQARAEREEHERAIKADAEARERAEERRAKRAEEDAERERVYVASCGASPTIDEWHGIPRAAYRWLKDNLNDDDFDVVSCSVPSLSKRQCWMSVCKIRGKNRLGAKILSIFTFFIRDERAVGFESTD